MLEQQPIRFLPSFPDEPRRWLSNIACGSTLRFRSPLLTTRFEATSWSFSKSKSAIWRVRSSRARILKASAASLIPVVVASVLTAFSTLSGRLSRRRPLLRRTISTVSPSLASRAAGKLREGFRQPVSQDRYRSAAAEAASCEARRHDLVVRRHPGAEASPY